MISRTISHYRILEKLGEGGMGVVYRAEDTRLRRTVALKFLSPELTRDAEAKVRFINEAQAASALEHPNVCAIHEIDEAPDGQMFMVMPCYEGESLAAKISRGPLELKDVFDVAIQIAQGLSKAHERGIVHRDIKPANIFVTSDGIVKILDFGLAKLAGAKITRVGKTLGTAQYMSPEQVRGEELDARSDIFSLGSVIYEMLTGQRAFARGYDQATLYAILNEEPEPVTAMRSGIPKELERIVEKCLRKNPEERYQHSDEVAADLRRINATNAQLSGHSQDIKTGIAGMGGRRVLFIGACLVAALAIGLLSRYRSHSRVAPGSERKMLVVLPFENLGSPDDEYFASGITEEITNRLATIREIGVISRTSAIHYAGTNKTAKQIGSELGVDYILEGSVRWARGPGGASKVRITPQLIRVSDDTHLWSEQYDRVIEDIFEIQSDIAQNVAEHLGLALLRTGHPAAESTPTSNMEAYKAYLRAEHFAAQPHFVAKNLEEAVENYERAVKLDPDFALAYAKLSVAHARLYYFQYDASEERRAAAKTAIERASQLEPNDPQIILARGYFHLFIERDIENAFAQFDIAARDLQDNAEILEARANAFRQEGHWEEAIDRYERACKLDPLNASLHVELANTYWWTRRYKDALDEADKAIALAPDQMWPNLDRAFVYWCWKGKPALEDARAALAAIRTQVDPDWMAWAWFFQAAYEGDYREAMEKLESFPNDFIRIKIGAMPKSLLLAQMFGRLGDLSRAREEWEEAKNLLEIEVSKSPDDPRYHSSLGIAYAALGRKEEAIEEGKRAVELLPMTKDAVYGIPYVIDLAQIYTILEAEDAALDEIERLLSRPTWVSSSLLEMDFRFDRLRNNSRFKRLIGKYSGTQD